MTAFSRRAVLALSVLAVVSTIGASGGIARAGTSYDGGWSVVIITEKGDCDRAYRYPVTIQNGQMRYSGEAGIDITGRVDDSGRFRATLSRGEQRAHGSGKLTKASGTGTWSGQSGNQQCSGRWEAERRAG